MRRRDVLAGGLVLTAASLLSPSPAGAAGSSRKRVLFFTKSSGFEHSVIRATGRGPSHAETVLGELAERHGWELTHTKDGGVFTTDRLARYHAFVFYTTGDLTTAGTDRQPPMTAEGKAALLAAVRRGRGFVGIHCAADTFHSPGGPFASAGAQADPYIQMLGGEFIQHGKEQRARMICADPGFPGFAGAAGGFELTEEWYSFKNYRKDLRVLLAQETEGMAKTGPDRVYDRPPYPATWARRHGRGRVFYTSMGHREDVWTNPLFQSILAGGIAWAAGQLNADATPNLEKVTPGYTVIPPPR